MPVQEDDIGFILKRIDDRLVSLSNRNLKEYNITASQIRTLEFLAGRRGEQTSLRDIEAFLCVAHPTIVGLVKRLEIKEFITVKVDERDKRFRQVDISDKGLALYEKTRHIKSDEEASMIKGFSSAEADSLRSMLSRISDNLNEA